METIKLTDGTELIPLEKEEKEKLEAELVEVLGKYNAMYLPVIKEEKTLTKVSQSASLFLLKRKEIPSPFIENGDNPTTTEETPKTD